MRVFTAPARYVQGPGVVDLLPGVVSGYAGPPLVISDPYVAELLGPRLSALLPQAVFRTLEGDVTAGNADAIAFSVRSDEPGVVVGVGGGKSLDAAKAVAFRLGLQVVTVPSVASNDSPASAAIAMYDDHHVMTGVDRLPRSPDVVLVDTALVATAPVALLRAGLGDAISKAFEARGCLAGTGTTPQGTRPLLIGPAIADACYSSIRRYGLAGLSACEQGIVTDDLEHLVEAVILMSGLGFENGGLSLAHSLTRGLMPARGARNAPHGEHVAWGLLVQLALEGRQEERADIAEFLAKAGLPTSLAALGLTDPSPEEIDEIVQLTLRAPHLANLGTAVTAEALRAAILVVER